VTNSAAQQRIAQARAEDCRRLVEMTILFG
jgi:hypothetical protein